MSVSKICPQCHAQVADQVAERVLERVSVPANVTSCPICGGTLQPYESLEAPGAPPATIDHRGIVLPPRHAVGGIVTPR